MKKPLALLVVYGLCAIVLERTSLVASALSGSASGLGWFGLLAFVALRLAALWIAPGWLLFAVIERVIEKRTRSTRSGANQHSCEPPR